MIRKYYNFKMNSSKDNLFNIFNIYKKKKIQVQTADKSKETSCPLIMNTYFLQYWYLKSDTEDVPDSLLNNNYCKEAYKLQNMWCLC